MTHVASRAFGAWNLELLWSLELGAWCFLLCICFSVRIGQYVSVSVKIPL
jgi:hypothetical protein